ncbi:hypothetical protein Pelo_15986 [Pelomyxa schiedti]|nr:hypothetical protein Pelo_15986 [Pelomyxa schiedti]
MATFSTTLNDSVLNLTAVACFTTTTRGQMGALAAAATVARCGAGSPMVAVMGRGHAAWLVRSLWSGLVRPTLRTFVLQVSGTSAQPSPRPRPQRPRAAPPASAIVSVSLSPLLLGAGPSAPSLRRPDPRAAAWVDSGRVVTRTPWSAGGAVLRLSPAAACEGEREPVVAPVGRIPWDTRFRLVAGPKWVMYLTFKQPGDPVMLNVVRLSGLAKGSGTPGCVGGSVSVDMPQLVGAGTIHMFYDHCAVDGEVIITISRDSNTVILVVDAERTYNSRSLALLSTTACGFPACYVFSSLVVMRSWGRSPPGRCGSRTFIVNTLFLGTVYDVYCVQEGTATSTPISNHVVDVFRVSDSLFCLSFATNYKQELFSLYDADDPTHPLDLIPSIEMHFKSNKVQKVMAQSGFIFGVSGNVIDVIEAKTGEINNILLNESFAPCTTPK